MKKQWCVYILCCKDGSLYTGITNELKRRIEEHNDGSGAKYTRARKPVKLVYSKKLSNRSEASKKEAAIKALTRTEKLKLIPKKKLSKIISTALMMMLLLSPALSFATDDKPEGRSAKELRYNLPIDITVTAASAATWLLMEGLKSKIIPDNCRWCGVNPVDNSVRDALKFGDTKPAVIASDVVTYGLAPMSAFGLGAIAAMRDGDINDYAIDALVIGEATAISALFSQIFKVTVARQRPNSHFGGPEFQHSDKNASFYSGHTNLAFTLAVASGTVAQMRGYSLAPAIWASGLTIATTVGYLRIAADQHYFTDVLGGAVIGSAIGFAMPYLFHRPKAKPLPVALSASPTDGGFIVGISGSI